MYADTHPCTEQVGSRPLEAADLRPVADKLRDKLIEKNVAADIGQQATAAKPPY